MRDAFTRAVGDPARFLEELPTLAVQFRNSIAVQHHELGDIRNAVKARNYEITNDPVFFRRLLGAFAVLLVDWYGQKIRIRGLFRKRLTVESKRFRADLIDVFYRCVFEGIDLAPEGEGLPTGTDASKRVAAAFSQAAKK